MRLVTYLLVLASLIFMTACDLPHQPGPMPSDIVETEFEPGLNIIGVLRADDVLGSSFVNVTRALTTEEIYSDTIENFSPLVDYVRVHSSSIDTEYVFVPLDDSSDTKTYSDTNLVVEAGLTYDIEISAPGFPVLTGETSIPQKPQLVANTLSVTTDNISFQLQHHSSAFEYKLYIIFSEQALERVVKPTNGTLIDIDWDFDTGNGTPQYLMLSALDENLVRYGNTPISFIPNTYHPDASTVSGGYGCFGSLSVVFVEL